jgi:hypothetical protein
MHQHTPLIFEIIYTEHLKKNTTQFIVSLLHIDIYGFLHYIRIYTSIDILNSYELATLPLLVNS